MTGSEQVACLLYLQELSLSLPPSGALLGKSPIGFQSQMFWELISQVLVLRVGVLSVGYKFFAPPAGTSGFQFPADLSHCTGGGVFGEILSQPFLLLRAVSLSFFQRARFALPVFSLLFPEKTVPYTALD